MYTITIADRSELLENACILMEAYIKINATLYAQPTFHATVVRDVAALLNRTIKHANAVDANAVDANAVGLDEILLQIVEEGLALFYRHIVPARSNGTSFIRKRPSIQKMQEKIAYLQNVPQPEQRTPEWYEFRYQHLTASNIWKTFNSDSTRNQLIFEKCQPLTVDKFSGVNIESPMHWGQKYESVSVQLYEALYKTQVSDFGCIPHQTHSFLAASPDGISTAAHSDRYGRMLEVKNIVNREITGIPKMEYWIQMQMQLEVCDLNECDFLETRFKEYPDAEAFYKDAVSDRTENKRGTMMLFLRQNGQPLYAYAPLSLPYDAYPQWQEEMMEKHSDLNWLKNIYWKLDQLSCVLVLRNKLWFAAALPALKAIWQTIETEKKSGYAHRGPKKNNSANSANSASASANTIKKVKKLPNDTSDPLTLSSKCFITIETF
jgi:putative phage-type endonuclease